MRDPGIQSLVIEPRDAAIFRDGKPFSAGLPARSLPFAPPSVVAGAVRTRIGEAGGSFDRKKIADLLKIEFAGPFLGYRAPGAEDWRVAFPAPADALFSEDPGPCWYRLQPETGAVQCDLPEGMVPLFGAPHGKPSKRAPAFWTEESMQGWLAGKLPPADPAAGFARLPRHRRVHVKIDPSKQTAEDTMLYATEGLEFRQADDSGRVEFEFALLAQVSGAALPGVRLSHIGGEGRPAYWHGDAVVHWPQCPALPEKSKTIRMILTTPAIFARGWKPGWLDEQNEGHPPDLPGLKLKLRAAAVPRALPLSGWDYATGKPKPTRLMAPAGSVYFFDVVDGSPSELWFRSVCDLDQDRRDGFGRVVVGRGDGE